MEWNTNFGMSKFMYWLLMVEKEAQNEELRRGQKYFNALCMVDSDLCNKLTDTMYDCFYDDRRCEALVQRLIEEWCK